MLNKIYFDTNGNTYLKLESGSEVVFEKQFNNSKHAENIASGFGELQLANDLTKLRSLEIWVRVDSASFMGVRTSMSFAKGFFNAAKSLQTSASLHGYKVIDNKIVEVDFVPQYSSPPNAIANIKPPIIELPNVYIREANFDDLDVLSELEEELFSREKWSRSEIEKALKCDDYHFLVLVENGRVVGASYLSLPYFKDDVSEIMSVGIFRNFQNKGYGKKLFNYAISFLENNGYQIAGLHVRSANFKAINLYKSAGFEKIHEIPTFYFNPKDSAIVMRKKLDITDCGDSKLSKSDQEMFNNDIKETDGSEIYLGIESSCDETGIAFIRDGQILGKALSSSMDDHQKFGGVIPEIAARKHLEVIDNVFQKAVSEVKQQLPDFELNQITAIGVSSAPGLTGALATGAAFAKGLSLGLNKPLYGVNHVLGHIMAFGINKPQKSLPKKFLSLIVSGGHTSLVLVDNFKFTELGGTLDDAAGEAFDKVGRMLGLNYPAGPEIDRLAQNGDFTKIKFPLPLTDKKFEKDHKYDFSFSGLKTAAVRELDLIKTSQNHLNITLQDFCASFAKATADVLTLKTLKAVEEFNCKTVVIGGGFSANSQLRKKLSEECQIRDIKFIAPPLEFCTDNGEMVANLTELLHKNSFEPNQLDFSVHSSYSLESPQCL